MSPAGSSSGWPLVATCARGLEETLAAELAALGLAPDGSEAGGVRFRGGWPEVRGANWRLRTANRVLVELGTWPAPDDAALYEGARELARRAPRQALDLANLLSPERTFAIAATTSGSALTDARWIALKVKDALVDEQRVRFGQRSSIDRRQPDVALRLRLHADRAALLLDTSGEPLDRRGYRVATVAAPVREQIAAACILASGWDGRGALVDPLCGSGTFLVEGAAIALGLAPNRLRARFAFETLPGHDAEAWRELRERPLPALDDRLRIVGGDRDPAAIAAARANLAAAGLAERVELAVGDAFELEPPPPPGLFVTNPPYGGRLAGDLDFWPRLGDLLKKRYRGYRAALLAGDTERGKRLGLRPRRRLPMWNGALETRLLLLDLY
ncbi:MAG: hypothetical protein U0X73_00335 [Thermoanaerobaculia bacterium]